MLWRPGLGHSVMKTTVPLATSIQAGYHAPATCKQTKHRHRSAVCNDPPRHLDLGRGSTPDPCQRAPLQPIGFRLRREFSKGVPWLPCSPALAAEGLLAFGVIRVAPGSDSGIQRQRKLTSGILAVCATS